MTLDLQAIFGEPLATAQVIERPEPPAVPNSGPATSGAPPSPGGVPQAVDLGPSGFDPADWTPQPDATGRRGWQRADFDAGDWPEFDTLPNPEPCEACGSLELWESLAVDLGGIESGGWRCMNCDPPTKSRALAARAAKLRQRAATCGNRGPDTPESATEATAPNRETSGASDPCATVYGALAGR